MKKLFKPLEECMKISCSHCDVYLHNRDINKECPQRILKIEQKQFEYKQLRKELEGELYENCSKV